MHESENSITAIACANCHTEVSGNYCSNCGQQAATHKLSWHFVWHDMQHAFLHFDKGVPFTLKALFTRPGHSIREFIQGRRVQHFKPISLVLLLGGSYGFLFHYLHIILPGLKDVTDGRMLKFVDWIIGHFSLIELINVPLYSVASWIAFREYRYNFIEHFVLNCFISAQRIAISLAFLPLLYLSNGTNLMLAAVGVSLFLSMAMLVWTYKQFFEIDTFRKMMIKFQIVMALIFVEALLLIFPIYLLIDKLF